MSIESEILRIQRNVANAYAAVSEKGGEVPLQPTSANLEAAVRSIQTGVTQEQLDEAMAVKQDKLTGHPGQVVGFNTSGTAQTVQGWSNPNLLDNWYFADPINQQGQAEYTGKVFYTIDRWFIVQDTDQTLRIVPNGITITPLTLFYQKLDHVPEEGQTVTFSAMVNGLLVTGSQTWSSQYKICATGYGIQLAFSKTEKYVQIYNESGTADDVISAVKLEIGPQQTLAHQDINGNWVLNDPPPNKALELLKCQRYLVAYRSAEIYNASVFFGTGILDGYDAEGNTSGQGYIVMPCAMRATPAIIGTAAIYSCVANAPIIRIDIIGVTGNVLRFNFTVTGQVSLEQRMCMIWTPGDFFITADL